MQYRRHYLAGGSYFFTVNLAERNQRLLVEHVDVLREAIRGVRNRHPFQIDAIVIMPNHLHAIFSLPSGDADYSTRWMLIKSGFSRGLPKTERINASRRNKGERGIYPEGTSGSADFGSIPSRTKMTFVTTSITFITIRSNTAMSPVQSIGLIPAFIVIFVREFFLPIGVSLLPTTTKCSESIERRLG